MRRLSRRGRRTGPWLPGLLLLSSSAVPALAAGSLPVRLHIPEKPTEAALFDLALQAGVSLGGEVAACNGRSPALNGRMPLQQALDRLLAGSGCRAMLVDSRTVLIRREAAAAAPAPPPARPPAAPRPPLPELAISEVIVTAERTPQLPGRTPNAVTALSGDAVNRAGGGDLESLAPLIAGMATTNLGPGRDKVFLRGLSDGAFTGRTQSTVGLYLDDAPITYNAPDPDLRLIDIERIEVLRGPQGTLYGAGSIGGIVRIVTRRPDLDQRSASLTAGLSLVSAGDLGESLEAVVNQPLVAGRAALRIAAFQEVTPGYINDVGLGQTNVNRALRNGGRLALKARLNDGWAVTAGGVHQSILTRDSQYAADPYGRLTRSNRLAEPHDNDFDALSLLVEGQGGWGRLTASSVRLFHTLDSRYDASDGLAEFGLAPGPATAFDDQRRINLWVNELTYASPAGGRIRWLAGGFLSSGETLGDQTLAFAATPRQPLYAERRKDEIYEAAVYGEATARLWSPLSLTLGARWFHFRYSADSQVRQGAVRSFAGKGEASGVAPKLLLSYRLGAGALAYLQVSQGYRAGGFNTSGPAGQSFAGGVGEPARLYDPDKLWNYEAGLKAQLAGGRLQLRMAVFESKWRNIQTDQFLASGLPFTLNVGDGGTRGVELEASWRVTGNLDLRLAGLAADAELTRANPAFPSRIDDGLPGTPNLSGAVSLGWTGALSPDLLVKLDASAAYVGHSTVTFDGLRTMRMGDYGIGRASASVTRGAWRLSLSVDNPTDSRANTFAFGNPFRLGKVRETTPVRPRTVELKLGVDF